jgi:hypothetical protein
MDSALPHDPDKRQHENNALMRGARQIANPHVPLSWALNLLKIVRPKLVRE